MPEQIRALFVDDEQRILNALRRTFRGSSWGSEFVQSGEAALKMFEETGPFHLVVTDQRMPGMTGVGLLRILAGDTPGRCGSC